MSGRPVLGTVIRDTQQQSSQMVNHDESQVPAAADSRSRPPSPPPAAAAPPKEDGSTAVSAPSSPPQKSDLPPTSGGGGGDSASPPSTGRTRPPSRPPSLSRPPSVYRPRSSSSVSRRSTSGGVPGSSSNVVYGGPGTALPDPKRLSVSSASGNLPPVSPSAGLPPSSPSLASSGTPVSPRIPEDSATASNASTDETTPSPPPLVAAKEPFSPPPPESSSTSDATSPPSTSSVATITAAAAGPAGAKYGDGPGTEEAVRPDPAAAAAWQPPTSASESVESGDEIDVEDEIVVVVRDYAFPRDDPRFKGKMLPEEIAAAAERKRFRDQEEEERGGGGGAGWLVDQDGSVVVGGGGGGGGAAASGVGGAGPSFHWGFVTSHAADFPGSEVDDDDDDDDEFDTTDSRHRGYAFHDPSHGDGFGDYADDGLDGGGGGGEEEEEEELGEFVPGVYSAVYAFEPELETEMRLVEGELVSVFERQCRGWVQAGRIVDNVVTEEIGLVPENYLALVEPHEGVVDWSTQDGEAEGLPAAPEEEAGTKGTAAVAEKSGLVDGEPPQQQQPLKSTETATVAAA